MVLPPRNQSHATTLPLYSKQDLESGDTEMTEPATAIKRPCPNSDVVMENQTRVQKSSTRSISQGPTLQVKGPDATYYQIAFNPRKTIVELKEELAKLIQLPVEEQSLRVESSPIECFQVQRGGSESEELEERFTIGGRKYRDYVAARCAMPTNVVATALCSLKPLCEYSGRYNPSESRRSRCPQHGFSSAPAPFTAHVHNDVPNPPVVDGSIPDPHAERVS